MERKEINSNHKGHSYLQQKLFLQRLWKGKFLTKCWLKIGTLKIDDLKDAGEKSSQKWLLGRPQPWKPFVTAGDVTEINELHKGIAEYCNGGLLSLVRIKICELTTYLSAQSQK